MKNINFLLVLLFIFGNSALNAQESSKDIYRSTVSVNATMFFANFVNFGNVQMNTPYIIDYRYNFNPKHQIRTGLNFVHSTSNSKEFNNPDRVYRENTMIDFRIGYLYNSKVAKKWNLFYGIDLIYSENNNNIQNKTNIFANNQQGTARITTNSISNSMGGGPLLGLQWNITDRISLWTESRFVYRYNENIQSFTWDEFSIDISGEESRFEIDNKEDFSSNTFLFMPLDVFVAFKF
jgi:hypothetical protein